ncbi:MAG TPA: hypothetical protein VES95_06295 [Dermatophilaceae bacterium]|nr:hypothetical protein [Dermatophilaceae bacterium]
MDVHLLWHVRHARNLDRSEAEHRDTSGEVLIDEGSDDVKLVGVDSSQEAAATAATRAPSWPGFSDEPDCFTIDTYTVDEDNWTDGFVTIPESSD